MSIPDQRFKEVAVYLNSYYNTMLTGEQVKRVMLKLAIPDVLEAIEEEYYTDTMDREYILELMAKEIVGISYPMNGDSKENKSKFILRLLYKKALFLCSGGRLLSTC